MYIESKRKNMLQKALNTINMQSLIIYFLTFLLFLFFLHKWVSTKSLKNKNLPPSPPKLPIIGHIHMLGMLPHRTLQTLSVQYGELMLLYFGSKPTLIVSSARVAKEVMKTHDAVIANRFEFIINGKLFYNYRDVVTSSYGEYWRQMKSIFVLQLLSNKRVRSFENIREEETALLMKKISHNNNNNNNNNKNDNNNNNGAVVDLSAMFMVLTNDLICRVSFGRKYGEDKKSGVDFNVIKEFVELLGVVNIGDFIPWLGWMNRFNGLNTKVERVAKRFDLLLEDIITEHLNRLDQARDFDNYEARDFVDVLLKAQREKSVGFSLERENIKAMILDAFAAGTDTTYTVLEWAMTELLRNPRIMKEVQKEVREIGGKKHHITEDDLENMKYLKAVMKETLRMYPPIPLLVPRVSTQDTKINGYDILADTLVFVNAWAVQRDPAIWEKPEEFRPERFLNSSVELKGQDFELIPFGGGRRICPAISFVMANNELVLANLMHKFNWRLPDGFKAENLDMSESTGLTIHRNIPLLAVATPHFQD